MPWRPLERSEATFRASMSLERRLWALRVRLREALGCSWGALGSVLGCFWGLRGSIRRALRSSAEASGAETTKKGNSLFSLRNSMVFEVSAGPKTRRNLLRAAPKGSREALRASLDLPKARTALESSSRGGSLGMQDAKVSQNAGVLRLQRGSAVPELSANQPQLGSRRTGNLSIGLRMVLDLLY